MKCGAITRITSKFFACVVRPVALCLCIALAATMGDAQTPPVVTTRARPIYFPPNPPPLGTMFSARLVIPAAPAGTEAATVRLSDLSAFETELFYAPLSSYLDRRPQPGLKVLMLEVQHYEMLRSLSAVRPRMIDALRAKIGSLEFVSPAARQDGLENLAREQTPKIVENEKLADEIRASLAPGASWFAMRAWRLGRGDLDLPREKTRSLEFQVVRAAAYYEDGFSPAQRRLLRELAIEMEESVFAKEDEVLTSRYFIFFSPDMARIRRPEKLPKQISAQLDVFMQQKDELKKELADALYEQDRTGARSSSRRAAFASLARAQADRLAALDEIAEEIRRDIATLAPDFPRAPKPVVLPQPLRQRLYALSLKLKALARERVKAVEIEPRVRMEVDEIKALLEGRVTKDKPYVKPDLGSEMAQAARQFAEDHREEIQALTRESEDISDEIVHVLGPDADLPVDPLSPVFIVEFLQRQKLTAAYRDYDMAVFEPGLSPEQRRMLFAAAVTALGLPQPGPERQAMKAPGTVTR